MKKNTLSKELKGFFTHVIDVYGDDVAFAMATWKKSMIESINYFSKHAFEKYTNVDLYIELIRNEVLCEENENDLVKTVKNMVHTGDLDTIFECIEFNARFKETLIKSYMNHAHIPYERMLKRCTDKDNIFSYIETIDQYKSAKAKAQARTKNIANEKKS